MKVGHFGDLHSREKGFDEIAKCAGFIVERMEEEKPDVIAFAGDASDSRDLKMDSRAARLIIETFSRLADVAPLAIVRGTPFHEGNIPEIYSMVRGKHPIHVSTTPEQIYLLDGRFTGDTPEPPYEPEIILSMMPQPTKEFFARTTQSSISESDQEISGLLGAIFMGFGGMAAQWPHKKHVLVFHGTARGAKLCNGQQMIGREIEISREHLELGRFHLGCFGHIHLPQEAFPGSNMFYASSISPENIGEDGDHGFWMHGWEGEKLWSEFIETPYQKISQVKINMTGTAYDLHEGLSDTDFTGRNVRVKIHVWQDESALIDRESIERELMARGASAVEFSSPVRVPRETVRSVEITRATNLPDKIQILAKSRGEEIPEGVLRLAEDLETLPAEQVLARVGDVA